MSLETRLITQLSTGGGRLACVTGVCGWTIGTRLPAAPCSCNINAPYPDVDSRSYHSLCEEYDFEHLNRSRTGTSAMPTLTEPIETERLRLRPFAETDLDELANILARPDVMRYLDREPMTRQEVAAALRQRVTMNRLNEQGDNLMLVIEIGETGQLIGSINLIWVSEEHAQGEIGYTLHPDHQGHGYASEATRAIIEFGFREIELHRIIGCCDDRNERSIRLLERVGMRREAHFREIEWSKGEWCSQYVYAILRDEWQAQQT